MKNLKHSPNSILAVCVLTLLTASFFTSCDDDHGVDFGQIVNPDGNKEQFTHSYRGLFTSHYYMGDQDFGATDTIDVSYTFHSLTTSDGDTITMYNVRFSSKMPYALSAIRIPDISNINSKLGQRHDIITPEYYMPAVGWLPYEERSISDLTGQIKGDSLILNMNCGGLPLEYRGKRKK